MNLLWTSLDTWIVVIAALGAVACALLGNFLVLRRMSMMGDAISHAVLPGLALGFLLSGTRHGWPIFAGAAAVGLLTAVFTEWVSHFGKVEESASMGVVFTSLFASGLVLIVRAADHVDLDPGCVLYGAIELAPLDTVRWLGADIPRAALVTGGACLANVFFITAFFKELKIASFDPELATTLGIPARRMHYLLMMMVAVTTVAAFESVGSILVIAMLIVPPATAYLLTDRLGVMVALSVVVAALCAAGGHLAAVTVPTWWGFADTSTSGSMAVVAGLAFSVSLLAAPRHGLVSRWWHHTQLSLRVATEDALSTLFRIEERRAGDAAVSVEELRRVAGMPAWVSALAVRRLTQRGAMERVAGALALTESGRREAGNLIRSHRLWESYLHEHLALPLDHLHDTPEQLEHVTSDAMQRRLAEGTADPRRDPHGHVIPERKPEDIQG
jgi:manganese/zinc/iron transport system permease protein